MLDKLFAGNNDAAVDIILQQSDRGQTCIVSFLYFANAMHHRLFEPWSKKSQTPTSIFYKTSLEKSDLLFPDGIALQLFSQRSGHGKVDNLNGTDFIPYFF